MGMTLTAQTYDYFEFVDKDGNVVPDGTTLTLTEVTTEEDVFGEVTTTMFANLKVRNKTSDVRYLRINLLIDRIDNGDYQLCFPMACKTYDYVTNVVTEGGIIMANELKDLQTEWVPEAEGGCDVTLTIEVLNMSGTITNPTYTYVCDGPTVTLHFRNGIQDEVKGDATGDGQVDIADVNAAIDMMLGKTAVNMIVDMNDVDNVDIADINALIDMMLGKR